MADINKDQVVDFLSNLPVIQIAELVKELEEKWGVSAAPVTRPSLLSDRVEQAVRQPALWAR